MTPNGFMPHFRPFSFLAGGLIGLSFLATVANGGPPTVPVAPVSVECDMQVPTYCGKAERACLLDDLGIPVPDSPPMGRGPMDDVLLDTDVLNNDLSIELFPSTGSLTGSNIMTIRSLVPDLSTFTFRLSSEFTISAAWLNGSTPVDTAQIQTSGVYGRVVTLDRVYGVGEQFTLRIDYSGTPAGTGFDSIVINPSWSYTLSEPYFSATWWPCKDGDRGQPGDNADRATLDMRITAPQEYRSVAAGLLQSVTNLSQSRRRYHWRTNYAIPTYLVFFSSDQYNTWTRTYNYPGGSMPVEFNGFTSGSPDGVIILTMLEVFRQKFGLYPFINEKYGVYRFGFGGGMEHPTSSGQGTLGSHSLSAHELAHQWWGDAITCRTWHDIWLNEGFATYGAGLWEEFQPGSPGAEAMRLYMVSRMSIGINDSVYCNNVSDWGRIFSGNLTYNKAAWVLHMLRYVVGDDMFWQILADYREAFEGGAATTDDFRNVVSITTGRDMTYFFDQWVYGRGNPIYEYAARLRELHGRTYCELMIRQTQRTSWPIFDMPLEVRLGASGPTEVVRNNARIQHYLFPTTLEDVSATLLDPNNRVLSAPPIVSPFIDGPPKILLMEPAPWQVLPPSGGPSAVRIGFSSGVSVVPADFDVTGPSGPIPFTLTYEPNEPVALLTFGAPLPSGDYTVTAFDSLIDPVTELALDGELPATPVPAVGPSGDGVPGGDAVWTFQVQAICVGDVTGDRVVDLADLAVLLANFGAQSPPAPAGDIDGDGDTDLTDLAILLAQFGSTCP